MATAGMTFWEFLIRIMILAHRIASLFKGDQGELTRPPRDAQKPPRHPEGTPKATPSNPQEFPEEPPKGVPRGPKTAPKKGPSKFLQKGGWSSLEKSLWRYKFQGFFDRCPLGSWGNRHPFLGPFWALPGVFGYMCIHIYIYIYMY